MALIKYLEGRKGLVGIVTIILLSLAGCVDTGVDSVINAAVWLFGLFIGLFALYIIFHYVAEVRKMKSTTENYKHEIDALQKSLSEGKITAEQFERMTQDLRTRYKITE
jgi:uncharacterized membrane protein